MTSPVTARVVIVDDHRIVREGLRSMLREHATIDIVGEADNGPDALDLIETVRPDVVLLDVEIHATSGFDLCRVIQDRCPGTATVFLTMHADEHYVFDALQAGARAYVLSRIGEVELVDVIEAVCRGEIFIDPAIAGNAAVRAATAPNGPPVAWSTARYGLTAREAEVLGSMTHGLSNRRIAEQLCIGEETVKSHVRAILRKLHAADRTQAVSLALREGLVR